MQTNEREIIIDHALENEENMAIVLDITYSDHLVNRINETLWKDHEGFVGVNIWHWHSLASGVRKSIIKTVVENSSDITFEQNDNANKGEIIIDYALENEKNLEMTLDIIFAGYELRQRIAKTFLEKLQDFIKKEKEFDMLQWDIETDVPFKQQRRYHLFSVTKKTWGEGRYSVVLRSTYGTAGIEIGVSDEADNASLIEKLNENLGQGDKDTGGKGWFKWLGSDYTNWQDPDTLIKMDTEEAVEDIGKYLLKIINVAEPVIDEWVKENAHNS